MVKYREKIWREGSILRLYRIKWTLLSTAGVTEDTGNKGKREECS